jgi:hypothetical protein
LVAVGFIVLQDNKSSKAGKVSISYFQQQKDGANSGRPLTPQNSRPKN